MQQKKSSGRPNKDKNYYRILKEIEEPKEKKAKELSKRKDKQNQMKIVYKWKDTNDLSVVEVEEIALK